MNESMDRVLADWLREGPESGPREGPGARARRDATRRPEAGVDPPRKVAPDATDHGTDAVTASDPRDRDVGPAGRGAGRHGALHRIPAPAAAARRSVRLATAPSCTIEGGDLFIADELSGTARAARCRSRDGRLARFLQPGRPDRLRPRRWRRVPGDVGAARRIEPSRSLGEFPGEFNGVWRGRPTAARSWSTSRKPGIDGLPARRRQCRRFGVARARPRACPPTMARGGPTASTSCSAASSTTARPVRSSPMATARTFASCRSTPSTSSTSRASAGRRTAST